MSSPNLNNIEQMEIAEPKVNSNVTVSSGFFITKKTIFLVGSVIILVFLGSILATHFGTKENLKNPKTTNSPPITEEEPNDDNTTEVPITTEAPIIDYRLPQTMKPFLYELQIRPYVGPESQYGNKAWTFDGEMKMYFECLEETEFLVFHSLDLDLDEPNLKLSKIDGSDLTIDKKLEYDKEREFFIIQTTKFEVGSNYTFTVPYKGKITDKLSGFYRGSYVENGKTYYLASTKFQPVDARKAFPCFDEPALKAEFKLTVIRHKDFAKTLFNTPMIGEPEAHTDSNWVVEKFERTVKMSTYLVAFVISHFEKIERKSPIYNVDIEVAGRPEAIKSGLGDFALDEAAEIIDFFSDYFNLSYPLAKSTQVGIPDFNSGAMENWGLVTYRESSLFYNSVSDAIANKQRVAKVISHELAHQWYGNLVTMDWWNDLWLNEGFASWVENLGLNKTHPEWNNLGYFYLIRLQSTLVKDSRESSHPISVDVNDPKDIGAIFDSISYSKGASIIRMMNAFLTEPTFRKGVSNYLRKYQFANTIQDNLWEELGLAGKEDGTLNETFSAKDIMDTWTLQKGYPVVHMKKTDSGVTASQEWFLLNPNNTLSAEDKKNHSWYVPVTFTTKSELNFDFETRPTWMKKEDSEISISANINTDDWIIGNVGHAGFYRVNYENENWALLTKQLKEDHEKIDALSRAALLDDAFNLGRAGFHDQTRFLLLTEYLKNEVDPLPFRAAFSGLSYIYNMLNTDSETSSLYNKFYSNLVLNAYNRLKWRLDLTDANEISLQTSVLRVLCRAGYEPCVQRAKQYYNDLVINNNSIPADFKSIVYYTVIENEDTIFWQGFYARMLKVEDNSERLRMLYALGKSKDYLTLQNFIQKTSDVSIVKQQDQISVIGAIASNPYGKEIAFNHVDKNWDEFYERYGDVSFTLPNLITSITSNFNTEFDIKLIERFMINHPKTGIATAALYEALETARTDKNWMDSNKQNVKEWLTTWISTINPDGSTTTEGLNTAVTNPVLTTVPITTEAPIIDYRLPQTMKPFLYELQIQPYIGPESQYGNKAWTFDGLMKMHLNVFNETSYIVFHSLDLDLEENGLKVEEIGGDELQLEKNFQYDFEREYFIFQTLLPLQVGRKYILTVPYQGKILEKLYGFYRSSYVENGKTYYLASTDFEPADARRAFPCFDEPAMKAEFEITIIRHKNFSSVLSNTNIVNTREHPIQKNWEIVEFERSVKMSTYLVAFVISNFEFVFKESPKYNVDILVAGRPEAIKNGLGNFALDEAAEIIDFFSDYFGIEYPLSKSTQVGIPNFSSGAMENWGLVTYRESSLFYNPDVDAVANKRRVSLVVSHELAHQWYGNLVTMAWWNDLWLNEGFASWVENLGMNHTNPQWRDLDYFFVSRIPVMVLDSKLSSHPVSVNVTSPYDVSAIFDSISYDKGASIIRMMNGFLTEPTFKKAVNKYLIEHQFDNTIQDDLWLQLTLAGHEDGTLDSDITVKEIMDTWTLQKGYPVVHMKKTDSGVTASQKWFLLNPLSTVSDEEYKKQKWFVPVTFTTKSELNFDFETRPEWLKPNDHELKVSANISNDDWIVGNLKHSGFYRVNYDKENWDLLIKQLSEDHEKIDAVSRSVLLDDSFNLGRAEIIDQTVYLDIASYLENEVDPLAFTAVFSGLEYISDMLGSDKEASDLFDTFYSNLLMKTYERNGWTLFLIDANDISLQTSALRILCRTGYQPCVEQAKKYYSDWINFDKSLPLNFKTIIYYTVIENGDKEVWNYLYNRMLKTEDAAEKLRMVRALAKSKDSSLLKFLLTKTSDTNIVKTQDELTIISDVSNNPYGQYIALEYIDQNWNEIYDRFGSASFALPRLINTLTSKLNNEYDLEKWKRFVINHPDVNSGVTTAASEQALETIQTNIRWMDKNKNAVYDWLDAKLNPEPQPPKNYRLPKDLKPSAYRLSVKPYFKSDTKPEKFDGKVEIDFECVSDTDKLVIHKNKLDLDHNTLSVTSVTDNEFSSTPRYTHTYDEDTHHFTLTFAVSFKKNNKYKFMVDYVGYTVDDNLGFYRSKYEDSGEKWIVASQMETVEARKSFPCFDEPEWKAKFSIKLIHDDSLKAFSNMPISKETSLTPSDGYNWKETRFEETLTMSTYLVAIVLADYRCKDAIVKGKEADIATRVCARPNAFDQLDLASNASQEILINLENFYNVSYPFPKLDHVATPTFKYGAMENWGLAIYLERLFIYNENSTQLTEQRVVSIIVHEIAHMWFGNLVTPKWWDDLWLNEGFARYMEYVGTDRVRPTWDMLDQHANLLLGVFHADAGENVRALSLDANTPEEIDAMVDPTITYGKGSAVVKMLNYILGSDSFGKALTAYFEKHKYSNVDQFDLWNALKEQGKNDNIENLKEVDLTDAMTQWTKQAGHPVVHVKVKDGKIFLTQNKFKLDSLATSEDTKWSIPFSYSIEKVGSAGTSSTNIQNMDTIYESITWFKSDEPEKTIDLLKTLQNDEFILANLDMAAYFRVNYEQENWEKIVSQLDSRPTEISLKMKAQLINDAFDLSQATYVNADLPLSLTKFLKNEMNYLPWNVFLSRYSFYVDMLYSTRLGSDLTNKMAKLVKPLYNFLGVTQDDQKHSWVQRMIRPRVVDFACSHGVDECVAEAQKQFNIWMNDAGTKNYDVRAGTTNEVSTGTTDDGTTGTTDDGSTGTTDDISTGTTHDGSPGTTHDGSPGTTHDVTTGTTHDVTTGTTDDGSTTPTTPTPTATPTTSTTTTDNVSDDVINENFKSVFACTAVKNGGYAEFKFLYDQLDSALSTNDTDLLRILSNALSCTQNRGLLNKYLHKSGEFGKERVQAIRNAAHNSNANDLAWNYLKENWSDLYKDTSSSTLSSLLTKITSKFNSIEELNDFENFWNEPTKIDDDLNEIKMKLRSNINWFNKSFLTIEQWLQN